uniref:Uncharacterized protein n=1 Tax=Heliothis virescens TaxID=7102 RepID=A0A2A4JSX9_HELVI
MKGTGAFVIYDTKRSPMTHICYTYLYQLDAKRRQLFSSHQTENMCDPQRYGWGAPPAHGFPFPPCQHSMFPGQHGMVYYPTHPAMFCPYPCGQQCRPGGEKVTSPKPNRPTETVKLPWSSYRWIPATLSQRSIPYDALHVGTDKDGDAIFAGRARHECDVLPANVIPNKNVCYVSWCGESILKEEFEVLVPATFSWQLSRAGEVPPGAVPTGVTGDGEKLYYGRVTHDGVTTPGKIQCSHGVCYYPDGAEERNSDEYEVLVLL